MIWLVKCVRLNSYKYTAIEIGIYFIWLEREKENSNFQLCDRLTFTSNQAKIIDQRMKTIYVMLMTENCCIENVQLITGDKS